MTGFLPDSMLLFVFHGSQRYALRSVIHVHAPISFPQSYGALSTRGVGPSCTHGLCQWMSPCSTERGPHSSKSRMSKSIRLTHIQHWQPNFSRVSLPINSFWLLNGTMCRSLPPYQYRMTVQSIEANYNPCSNNIHSGQ